MQQHEEQQDERRMMLEQCDELEQILQDRVERARELQRQVRDLSADVAAKRERIEVAEEENMKLRLFMQQQQEVMASNFRYAPAFDALQQQMNEQRSQAQEAEKNFEETKSRLETALKVCQDDLRDAQARAQTHAAKLQKKLDVIQQEQATSLRLKLYHIDSLLREVQQTKKEHEDFKSKVNARLYAQEQQVEEKTRELQQQRMDHAATIASYDQRLQKARMQYEEHLLQVTAKAGRDDAPQEEYWRRKMATQKREYESQLADLKKKLDELQLTVASLRGHSSSAGSQPRYGRQSKVATTLALTCINHPL